MITGETLCHDEQADEDYLDPHYLHTAAELYEMQSQLEAGGYPYHPGMGGGVEFEFGQNLDPFSE